MAASHAAVPIAIACSNSELEAAIFHGDSALRDDFEGELPEGDRWEPMVIF
jgi:hypothetical protein